MTFDPHWKVKLNSQIIDFAVHKDILPSEMLEFMLNFIASLFKQNADEEDARELCRLMYKILIYEIKCRKI